MAPICHTFAVVNLTMVGPPTVRNSAVTVTGPLKSESGWSTRNGAEGSSICWTDTNLQPESASSGSHLLRQSTDKALGGIAIAVLLS